MINLKEVITKYPESLKDGNKLKGILSDLYPQEKLYAGILSDMLSDGIVAEIKDKKELDSLTFSSLCNRIENNRGLAHKHVEGCLNIWANAFDVKIKTPPAPPKLVPVERTHRKIENIDDLHEHKYTKTVVPPTCTEKGYTLYSCDCGYEYKNNFVNPEHDFILVEYAEPTCEKEGRETYKCSRCGEEKINILPATGHNFGKWIEQTKPTCTKAGKEVRQCSKCGKKETRAINATGHNFSEWRIEGDYKIRDCKNCGKTEKYNYIEEQRRAEQERKEKEKQEQEKEQQKLREEQLRKEREESEHRRSERIGILIAILVLFVLPIGGCVTFSASDNEGLKTIGMYMLLIGGGFWVWIILNSLNKK